MNFSYRLNNIKCAGCAFSIEQKVASFAEVKNVMVDVEKGSIKFEAETELSAQLVLKSLENMGYTQHDPTLVETAKSYVSCMVGKVGMKVK